jgi:hypothetical protein
VREKELEKEKERARNKEVEDALLATVWVDRQCPMSLHDVFSMLYL